jgi:cytoskeletal protein CcmA (bactofilin family)
MRKHRNTEPRVMRAAVWMATALLAALLGAPIAALAGDDSDFSDLGGNYKIPAGKTHHGNLSLFKGTVTIAGTQDGDLRVIGGTLEVTGEVTGKIRFFGGNLSVAGKVGKDLEARGANCRMAGTVGGDLDAKCGTVVLPAGSEVKGDADIYAGEITVDGAIDGDLSAEGGQISLAGTVGKDATLHADVIKLDPKARIAGNLSHESRVPLNLDEKEVVGGTIDQGERIHVRVEHHPHVLIRVLKWFGWLALAFLVGLAALALGRKPGAAILAAAETDLLRNVGVGFLAFIVVPVAAVVSCILIVTIPLALAVLIVYGLAVYLAKVPVAVLVGRKILARMGRPEPSTNASFATGIVVLYVLFAIPVLRWIFWFACVFLGLGAMVLGLREWRQARKKGIAAAPPDGPPQVEPPPLPPAVPPEVPPEVSSGGA